MGLSSSKSKTVTDQKTSENATTTPVNPPWVTDAIEQYTGRLGAFGDTDPTGLVAGPAPLQLMAWQNAGSLADWQKQARLASERALEAAQAGPASAGQARTWTPSLGQAASFEAPRLGPAPAASASRMETPRLGEAATGRAATWQAPEIGPAATWQAPSAGQGALVAARGYRAPELGAPSTYAAPRIGAPAAAAARGYVVQPTERIAIAPTADAAAASATGQSLLTDLGAYRNPFNDEVTARALEDFDLDAARTRARQMADGARAGAFGGSRFGLAQAQTESELARARGALAANLRAEGFDRAAMLSSQDAERRQQAGLLNAQNMTGISQANAAAANLRAVREAELGQERALADSAALARAREFGAAAANEASRFNSGQDLQARLAQSALDGEQARHWADVRNQFVRDQAAMQERAGQLGANLAAQADLANQSSSNAFAELNARLAAEAGAANASALNQFALARANLDAEARRGSAGAEQAMALANLGFVNDRSLQQGLMAERAAALDAQNGQQTALANLDLQGRYGLAQAQMDFDRAARNAEAADRFGLANMDALNRSAEAGAAAHNQFALADAAHSDAAAARRLQAAGLLGDIASAYAGNVRADLGTMAQLGDQQRAIESQYAMAPLAQLQALGELYGTTPYNLFSGNNVSSTGTASGTSITKSSPSLFNQMLAAASVAGSFVKPG